MRLPTNLRKTLLVGAALPALAAAAAGLAWAQTAPVYDPAQLPATKGTVAHYALTPRGDVDGLILADGTEVHLPPHLGTQLVYAVRPGDKVTVHGLKALRLPLVAAVAVTNDADGRTVVDAGPPPPPPGPRGPDAAAAGDELSAEGKVQLVLHGPRGEVNGAMLENGTILHLPPPEAERLADLLSPGRTVAAKGPGLSNLLGTVIDVRRIGPSPDQLAEIAAPPPPPPPHGPKGHRPPPPPPPAPAG